MVFKYYLQLKKFVNYLEFLFLIYILTYNEAVKTLLQVVTAQLFDTNAKNSTSRNVDGNRKTKVSTNVTITWSNRDLVYGKTVNENGKVVLRFNNF